MYSLSILVLAGLLAFTEALSIPRDANVKEVGVHSFKVRTLNHNRILVEDPDGGSHAMLKVSRKYGIEVPPELKKRGPELKKRYSELMNKEFRKRSLQKRQLSSAVSAVPDQALSEYLSPVKIGGQTLVLDFDTGSSDLWVFSTSLRSRGADRHTLYNPKISPGFKQLNGASWRIQYGDGSQASGTVGTDEVEIGGIALPSQVVELATNVSQDFIDDVNIDGLLGLGFSRLNTVKPQKQKTFFDNVLPMLEEPVFTADLLDNNTGVYEFGRVDPTLFKGKLTTIPIMSKTGFWAFPSRSIKIDAQLVTNQEPSMAIADTGTSLILVDDAMAKAYYRRVPGSRDDPKTGGFVYPCASRMPDLSLAIGSNYMAVVPGKILTFSRVTRNTCFGGLQSNQNAGVQIYGDIMFRSQFVVFNGSTAGTGPSILMAPKAGI